MIRPVSTQALFSTPEGLRLEFIKAYDEEDAVVKGEQLALSRGWELESLELLGYQRSVHRCNRCEGNGFDHMGRNCKKCGGRGYKIIEHRNS